MRRTAPPRRPTRASAAADANLRRLQELEGFKHVVAPFDGVITRRSVDVGTLVGAGAPPPLFQLAQTDPLRVFVSVPESDAAAMRPGLAGPDRGHPIPGRDLRRHGRPHERARSTRRRVRSAPKSTCPIRTATCSRAATSPST